MALSEPTGGAVVCTDPAYESSACGELIEQDWARWVCTNCGATVHYACLPGGVPVRGPEQLEHEPHGCGGRWECHWHADENQGSLFG